MAKQSTVPAWAFFSFVILFASIPADVRAQSCAVEAPWPTRLVAGIPASRFLPNGSDAQIVVRKNASDTSVVRVFETNNARPDTWKEPNKPLELNVLSVKAAPEKTYVDSGFLPSDSSIIRFQVPYREYSFWDHRTFVVRFCETKPGTDALAIVSARVSPPVWSKLISGVLLALFYVLFAVAVSRSRAKQHPLGAKYPSFRKQATHDWVRHLDPVILTANAFNSGSIQKLQVLLFTLLVSGMVLSLVLTLGVLSDLSPTVALLLGISAVGAAVAQKTATNKDRLDFENWAWLVRKDVLPINPAQESEPKWGDLVVTNREFDVYKLQTLIFSIVVAVALLVGGEERLASFSVPDTLLGILGLSQVVYVAGTLARPPSMNDLDQALTNLRQMESRLQTVVERNTDTDVDGNLPDKGKLPPPSSEPLETRKTTAKNAMRLYAQMADKVEIMIESTLGTKVDRSKLDPSFEPDPATPTSPPHGSPP